MNINFEEVSFEIIAYAGEAKGHAMQAIQEAKKSNFEKAYELLEDSEKSMIKAEQKHMDIVSEEANGVKFNIPVLFMHAEDQLLTTQTLMILAKEFIELYKKI